MISMIMVLSSKNSYINTLQPFNPLASKNSEMSCQIHFITMRAFSGQLDKKEQQL